MDYTPDDKHNALGFALCGVRVQVPIEGDDGIYIYTTICSTNKTLTDEVIATLNRLGWDITKIRPTDEGGAA